MFRRVRYHWPLLVISTLSAISSQFASADELKWTHYGVRPLAMGNAFVAVANDYNALFYNPAGLARLESWSMEIINPTVGVSANTIATVSDVMKLTNGASESSGKTSVQTAIDTFEVLSGKPQYINLGLTPHLVFPGFGFAIGLDIGGTMTLHRQISADLDLGVDVIIPFTYAKSMLEDRLSLGATVKAVGTSGVDREFSLADVTAFTKNDGTDSSQKKLTDYVVGGRGVGADIGLLFTPVKTMEPTLGISIMDIGGTPYQPVDDTLGTPKPRDPTVNTGVSFKPVTSGNMYLLTSLDVHAINQPIHYSKKVNVGTELGLGKMLKLQAGLHQGELSGGVQLDAWLLILRFATYAEQLGATAGEDKLHADRRYVAQLKLLL